MLINWIEISLLGFGICLSTCYFLRSCYLKRISAKKIESLQKKIEDGFLHMGHKIELVDRQIQDMSLDIKDLNTRTTIVETRLEERNAAMFLSASVAPKAISSPKRGRPRKNPE